MSKISSASKFTYLLSLCALCFLSTNPSYALLNQDFYLEKSFFNVPVELEKKLSKKVDFSFNEVLLSEMIVLMSKIGDFNIVFPKELDRTVSMQIKQQSIKHTLEDIALLYDYEYDFKKNTVVFKNQNPEQQIALIPLKYLSATKVLNLLDENLFDKVKLSKDPGLNNILVVGSKENITFIQGYIKSIDKAPKQKIFLPEFIGYKEIQRYLKNNLNEKADVEVVRLEQDYILLSGNEDLVEKLYKQLEQIDKPFTNEDFKITAYRFNGTLKEQIEKLEPDYLRKELFRIDQDLVNFDFYSPLATGLFSLTPELLSQAFSLDIQFSKDILDIDSIGLVFDSKESFFKKDSDLVLYFISEKDLKKNPLLREALGLNDTSDLILSIKVD